MGPTHQRFRAIESIGVQIKLRLVVDLELVFLHALHNLEWQALLVGVDVDLVLRERNDRIGETGIVVISRSQDGLFNRLTDIFFLT